MSRKSSPTQLATAALQQIARHEKECGERYGEVQSELRGLIEKISNLQKQVSAHSRRWEKIAFLIIGTIVAAALSFWVTTATAETNTVTSTVIDKSVPASHAPNIVVNNSDLCHVGSSGAITTSTFGFSSGITTRDFTCERLKLFRALWRGGMKVAAIALLSQAPRIFDAMMSANTPPPFDGKIGDEAKKLWLKNRHLAPEGSRIHRPSVNSSAPHPNEYIDVD